MTRRHKNYKHERELLLNEKIREFQNKYYALDLQSSPQYQVVAGLRRKIKHPLSLRKPEVWQKPYNRKHAYFNQLALFKSMHALQKRDAFFTCIEHYHDMPRHMPKCIGAKQVPSEVFGT